MTLRWARDVLSTVGVDPAWRALEIGAGAGSVAIWPADQCPRGSVTAVDIDTRYLDGLERPNLRVQQGDISTMDFAPGSFDLIHARLTFCHLPNRDEVLAKAAEWLAPGGWLVIGDLYSVPEDFSVYKLRQRFLGGIAQLYRAQGTELAWVLTMPASHRAGDGRGDRAAGRPGVPGAADDHRLRVGAAPLNRVVGGRFRGVVEPYGGRGRVATAFAKRHTQRHGHRRRTRR